MTPKKTKALPAVLLKASKRADSYRTPLSRLDQMYEEFLSTENLGELQQQGISPETIGQIRQAARDKRVLLREVATLGFEGFLRGNPRYLQELEGIPEEPPKDKAGESLQDAEKPGQATQPVSHSAPRPEASEKRADPGRTEDTESQDNKEKQDNKDKDMSSHATHETGTAGTAKTAETTKAPESKKAAGAPVQQGQSRKPQTPADRTPGPQAKSAAGKAEGSAAPGAAAGKDLPQSPSRTSGGRTAEKTATECGGPGKVKTMLFAAVAMACGYAGGIVYEYRVDRPPRPVLIQTADVARIRQMTGEQARRLSPAFEKFFADRQGTYLEVVLAGVQAETGGVILRRDAALALPAGSRDVTAVAAERLIRAALEAFFALEDQAEKAAVAHAGKKKANPPGKSGGAGR